MLNVPRGKDDLPGYDPHILKVTPNAVQIHLCNTAVKLKKILGGPISILPWAQDTHQKHIVWV